MRFIPSAFAAEHGGDDALLTGELKSQLEDFFAAAVVGTGKEVHFLSWRNSEAAMARLRRSAAELSRLRVE